MAFTISKTAIAVAVLCCVVTSSAKEYTVGDAGGWTTNADYTTWTSGKTFTIGDTLVFNYASTHNVAEVSASDYNSCSASNSISLDSSGATKMLLNTTGSHYFICGTPGHCDQGMKLAVKVGDSATATPETPATPTTTTTPTSSSPPSTTSSRSASSALSPSMVIVLTGVVVALLKFVVS